MKKIRLNMNLSLNLAAVYVALFCVTTYALMEHVSTTIHQFSLVKMPLMYVGAICLLTQTKAIFRVLLKRNYFFMLLTVGVFCLLLLCTLPLNRDVAIGGSPLTHTVRLVLYLAELFLVMMLLAEHGQGRQVMKFLFWYTLVLVAANDLLMFSRAITFRSGKFEIYLVGTKFAVSYRHMNLLTLWAIQSKRSLRSYRFFRWIIVLVTAFIVLTARRVDCMTGVLGGIGLMVLLGVIDSPRRNRLMKFTSPAVFLMALIGSVVFVFVAEAVMNIPAVEYFVEEILVRDTTITGRTNIYEVFVKNMAGGWLAGFGYGNGNDAATTLFGYENVQNGLLQWVLQIGVPATIGLVAVLLQVFRQIRRRKAKNMEKILPLVAMLYVYVILGMVETTFDMAFLLWFAVIFMLVNERIPAAGAGTIVKAAVCRA